MREMDFATNDGKSVKLHIWDGVDSPRGIVQIFHGMAEHSLRYSAFAEYLNSQGFVVYAEDHRAHGKSAESASRQGCPDGDIFEQTLRDEKDISDYILKEHAGLPLYIFGHSYGSFLGQKYIQSYGNKIAGIVLSGSNKMNGMLLAFGKMIAKNRLRRKGPDYVSEMILKSGLKKYGKRFGGGNTWLTSVEEEVQKYDADEFCGRDFPCGFYYYFFKGLSSLYTKEGLMRIPRKLPILLLSGEDDPVGDYGKGVKRLYKTYQKSRLSVNMRLFPKGRHEMLNEEEREEVFETVSRFFESC